MKTFDKEVDLLASACMKFGPEQAGRNSGGRRASWGRILSTRRSSEARLLLWMWRARKRPI